jgi:hypothetical protein
LFGGITPYCYNNHYLYDSILTNSHQHLTEKPLKISWSNGCECGCDKIKDVIRPNFNFPLSFCLNIPDKIIMDLYKHGYYQAKLFFENIQDNKNIEIIKSIETKLKDYDDKINNRKLIFKQIILLIGCLTIIYNLQKSSKTIAFNIRRIYNSIRTSV